MTDHPTSTDIQRAREHIGGRVRALRKEHRWTQADLARRLHLSQNRLSELERGRGSFAAEHLIELIRLFRVDIAAFDPTPANDDAELQSELLRYGARHLRPVSARISTDTAAQTVLRVLTDPRSERFVTALAPVLVHSVDQLPLPAIQLELANAGVPARLCWLVQNTHEALRQLPPPEAPADARQERRAQTVLGLFLQNLPPRPADGSPGDILDAGVRTDATRDRVWDGASPVSRRWGVVSALKVADFADALRMAREPRR